MPDFLLELLSEEIPARMQAEAAYALGELFKNELSGWGILLGGGGVQVDVYSTPRRLALLACGLPAATEPVTEELKGPRADAPAQAIAGFLGKTGLSRELLVERADAKGHAVLFAVKETPGRPTADVLADAVPAIVRGFPWPKSMRWGAASLSPESPRWVRPLQGIVALLDEAVVPCEAAGVASGRATAGHRFMHSGAVTIARAGDYAATLRAAHVIVDPAERQAIVRERAEAAARDAGLRLVPDKGLVAENAGLTEWPVPLLGRFDPAFLDVPREVIQLTMRTNQRYFACTDGDGALAPAFVCTANIEATDGGAAIVAGNARVLAARLADARFFWEGDKAVPLDERAAKLSGIVFHEKLGTVADKVARIAKLARWLVEEGIVGGQALCPPGRGLGEGAAGGRSASPRAPHPGPLPAGQREALADLAERAARLCKADLVTGMVGEFPELQGIIGGHLAAAQGEDPQVAAAIRDHYKPVGQGDEVPTAPATVAVSLADKLDTIAQFFYEQMPPTGSKDPFALRRAALGVILTIIKTRARLSISLAIRIASMLRVLDGADVRDAAIKARVALMFSKLSDATDGSYSQAYDAINAAERSAQGQAIEDGMHTAYATADIVLAFFADRLKVQQREAGVRHDLIDAVFALGGEDDLVRLLARVKALQAFLGSEDGANLLAGYRRAANILRKEGVDALAPAPTRHPGPVPGSTPQPADTPENRWTPEQVRGDEGVMPRSLPPSDASAADRIRGDERSDGFGYAPEPAEAALADALAAQLPAAAAAVAEERFGDAMAALAALRAPIDAFFDTVTVNDPDPERRTARLGLLGKLVAAMHNVADFSKIEG